MGHCNGQPCCYWSACCTPIAPSHGAGHSLLHHLAKELSIYEAAKFVGHPPKGGPKWLLVEGALVHVDFGKASRVRRGRGSKRG